MAVSRSWLTCCLHDLVEAGNEFQLAALPADPNDGQVHAALDIDAFHIFQDSPHPNESLEVIAYLITTSGLAQALDVLPAIEGQRAAYLEARAEQYPFVSSWQPLLDGVTHADLSLTEGYLPNFQGAWFRLGQLGDQMAGLGGLYLPAEIIVLENDLTAIFQE
jgi:ABC-type glycerol-3-phosphate transport system substrate-binding protein